MADVLVTSRGGWDITWGARLDLVTTGTARQHYINAIRAADDGDLTPLLAFAQS